MQITQQRYYTPEEYLELEEIAEYKSEYIDGQIIPMAGGTINHNQEDKAIALVTVPFEISLQYLYNKMNFDLVESEVQNVDIEI
jgi:hypothetical protein